MCVSVCGYLEVFELTMINCHVITQLLNDVQNDSFDEEDVDAEYQEFLKMQQEFAELRGENDEPKDKVETLAIEVMGAFKYQLTTSRVGVGSSLN